MMLILSMLGGLWLPSFLLPAWVQRLAWPCRRRGQCANLEGVTWQGMGWSEAVQSTGMAWSGFSVVFLAAAWWRLARCEPRLPSEGTTVWPWRIPWRGSRGWALFLACLAQRFPPLAPGWLGGHLAGWP